MDKSDIKELFQNLIKELYNRVIINNHLKVNGWKYVVLFFLVNFLMPYCKLIIDMLTSIILIFLLIVITRLILIENIKIQSFEETIIHSKIEVEIEDDEIEVEEIEGEGIEVNKFNGKYENNFIEKRVIGSGSFGEVFEVILKSNEEFCAIKRVEITDEMDFKEIQIMSKLNYEFVVKCIDAWIEESDKRSRIKKFLHIQMELCSMNLSEFIDLMNEAFDDRFKICDYFISCELFKGLTECVDYLHSLKPAIIHRDLNPKNVLISNALDINNGRILKLCDFGLAKIHEISVHTRKVGTTGYMAPEVRDSENYNTKSDIYSLALIATEIFQFEDNIRMIIKLKNRIDFNKYLSKYVDTILETNSRSLLETISNCLLPEEDYHSRPDCKQLLKKINAFSIDKSIVLNDENFSSIHSVLENQNKILKQVFEYKIRN